jgi:glycosyltransferase involved in cell wall biosynthesis
LISVIIGTGNSERALVPTLSALVAGAAAGIVREVIIADAGSTDATAEIAELSGCELMVSQSPLAIRLADAAKRARGVWLMFLRPGVVLDTGWIEETSRFVARLDDSGAPQSHAAVFRRETDPIAARASLRDALAALGLMRPHPEQGLIINKRLYDELGGHRGADPEADLLARLGRRRTIVLRTGAIKVADGGR